MKRLLLRAAAIGAALALLGFLVAASGLIPIKASSGHWALTEWFLRFSMKRSIATHSLGTKVPSNLGDAHLIQKGAGHYDLACRSCHGEPQGPRPRQAAHMLPVPPDLAPRVQESNPRKLFEVVKHGMKFTGMPAWPAEERDDEVWAMVAFLLKYPSLSAEEYQRLAGRNTAAAATATGDTSALLQSCIRCHDTDGNSHGNVLLPRLAGQRAEYLRNALRAYAADTRHSGIMEHVATELPPRAMAELAMHYAALPAGSSDAANVSTDPAAVARGALIARNGLRDQRVPACLECHAPAGHRTKPEYPLLAGQPAAYLELQLQLFRENRRGGSDHAHLMQPIGARLKPEQAREVAHYFASLPRPGAADPAPRNTR